MESGSSSEYLAFFKALADKNRLKIVGILAREPHAVEDIARALRLGASTVSHHLSVLARAGLVEARAHGYYSVYSLKTAPLQEAAKHLLKRETLQNLAAESGEDEYARKVLATFVSPDGAISAFPMQEKKFIVLLRYVLREFEPGVRYTEKQMNAILGRFNKDTARLRRGLVEYRFMDREGGGGKYWRIA
jgi:predicted transcriptional regulator